MRECRRKSRWLCAEAASQLRADADVMTSSAALGLSAGHNVDGVSVEPEGISLDRFLNVGELAKAAK